MPREKPLNDVAAVVVQGSDVVETEVPWFGKLDGEILPSDLASTPLQRRATPKPTNHHGKLTPAQRICVGHVNDTSFWS